VGVGNAFASEYTFLFGDNPEGEWSGHAFLQSPQINNFIGYK